MNDTLHADEFVFTILSAEYSPHGTGGYQVVHASPGLPEQDRQAIQERVGLFERTPADEPRQQFFRLPGGGFAVTVSRSIVPDKERSDPRGGYLAYALAVDAAEFADAAGSDPFRLLDVALPPATAREVVDRYGAGSRPVPRLELTPAPTRNIAGLWAGTDLRALLALALGASALTTDRRAVLFHGPFAGRVDALRLALQLAPQVARAACTFDSHGTSHLARAGGLWAVGLAEPPREPCDHPLVDASTRRVSGELPPPQARLLGGLYDRWFEHATRGGGPMDGFRSAEAVSVESLAATIEADTPLPVCIQPGLSLCADLCEIWSEEVRAAAHRRLAATSSAALADGFAPAICAELDAPELVALATGRGLNAARLAPLFAGALLVMGKPKLYADDWRCLERIAAEGGCPQLDVLVKVLAGEKDDTVRRRAALARLTNAEFAALLRLCPSPASPALLVAEGGIHSAELAAWAAGRKLPDKLLTALLEEMLLVGAGGELAALTEQTFQMRARSLARLDRTLAKHPEAVCPFRERLRIEVAAMESRGPWWQRLLPGWRKAGATPGP